MNAVKRITPRRFVLSVAHLIGGFALIAFAHPVQAQSTQFLYGITNDGKIYEADVINKTTTLAFSTNLTNMNGLAFNESGQQGGGQLFYRAGSSSGSNGDLGLYVWNRRTNAQAQVTVSSAVAASQKLPGSSSNASWYNGAYWYVQQGTDTLTKVAIDTTNVSAPFVSSITNYTNFDGTIKSSYAFGDISISSDGILYGSSGSSNSIFFQISVASGAPVASTYSEVATSSGQVQLGFGSNGTTLYGEAAGSGAWYTVDKTTGAQTSLGFTSAQSFNDLSEGSTRSILQVAAPEPGTLTLLGLGLTSGAGVAGTVRLRRKQTR